MYKILFIALCIMLLGCSTPLSNLSNEVDSIVGDRIRDIGSIDLPQLVITQKINYFLFPLFLGLFVSIILIVSGVRVIGIGVLLASVTCIFLIITMVIHLKLIAWIGVGVLLIGLYFLGKNIFDRTLAQRELVDSVQTAKFYISDKNKEELGVALQKKQSDYTKAIVKEIKS